MGTDEAAQAALWAEGQAWSLEQAREAALAALEQAQDQQAA